MNLDSAIQEASRKYSLQANAASVSAAAAAQSSTSAGNPLHKDEVVNPMDLSISGLKMHNMQRLSQQDEIIAEIGTGVERVHQQALDIGEEASIQHHLISKLDESVEAGAEALKEEALHAEAVRKTTRMCRLYMCLALEAVILLIVIVMYIQHGR